MWKVRLLLISFSLLLIGTAIVLELPMVQAQRRSSRAIATVPAAAADSPVTAVASVGTERRQDDFPAIAAAADGSFWVAWLSYAERRDEIFLRRYSDGKWGNLQRVPGTSGDSWLPQIAVDAQNHVWVVWSQQRDGNWDIYARFFDPSASSWGPLERLTDDLLPDVNPRLARHVRGELAIVWQGFRQRNSNIYLKTLTGGMWSETIPITARPANEWEPAAAFGSDGTLWVVYDSYKRGNYDVYLTGVRDGKVVVPETAIAESPRFEARPTVAVDRQDRVWVAWEAGGPNWGKDTGYKIRNKQPGVYLGAHREVKVRCFANGQLRDPAQPLQQTFTEGAGVPKWTYQPHIFADGRDNVWVIAKRRIHTARGTPNWAPGYWEYWLARYEGDHWTAARPLPRSWGRSSTRVNAAVVDDGLWLAWSTDNRREAYPQRPIRNEALVGQLQPPGEAPRPVLLAPRPEQVELKQGHPNEPADIEALQDYRTTVHGRQVQLLRGDFHRHTEISWDDAGMNDGSLQDFYRYVLDVAALDYGASTDHQGGGGFDYRWWYSQKMTDMYHVPGTYVGIFGFERSLHYPNGHRNVLYADRSGMVAPYFMRDGVERYALGDNLRGEEPGTVTGDVVENDTKLLYEEIRRMGGISIPHSSGTNAGTDWRDNDARLEPVVELFQGLRTSYEYTDAPLSADPNEDKDHIKVFGYEPAGFVRQAWEKGLRLGVIASSDHYSTHYSYAMVYTDRATREGLLDAFRRRHTYGATDNILLDVRTGDHFMGDEFSASGPLPIQVTIRGTQDIKQVDVIRGDRIIYSISPNQQEVRFEYTDREGPSRSGVEYYYVRLQQVDDQFAWSSPMWVHY